MPRSGAAADTALAATIGPSHASTSSATDAFMIPLPTPASPLPQLSIAAGRITEMAAIDNLFAVAEACEGGPDCRDDEGAPPPPLAGRDELRSR
jgi:hypothetical protein